MEKAKKGSLPVIKNKVLRKAQCPVTELGKAEMTKHPYASAIGSIMYAMLSTRPDVALALSLTSRFQSNPGMPHWVAVKSILKYLNKTKEMFLVYGDCEEELGVTGYVDASFCSDPDDSKSQTGYVFKVNGGAVCWRSGKQLIVAQSTMESEYIAACEAANEAVWLRKFVIELGVFPSVQDPVVLFCDNTGAIANAKEPRSHSTAKHILRRFHVIRQYVQGGDVKICKVHTDLNVADPLTKPLPLDKHEQHQLAMGVKLLPSCNLD